MSFQPFVYARLRGYSLVYVNLARIEIHFAEVSDDFSPQKKSDTIFSTEIFIISGEKCLGTRKDFVIVRNG